MHQSAFVKDRSIHDNFMLVQSMARRLHALREAAVMLKLDISKAFNSVRWPFMVEKLFQLAVDKALLSPLASRGLAQGISMFSDGVMIFLRPELVDLQACVAILQLFGEASGLRVNLAKCAALPIRCTTRQMEQVPQILGCPIQSFPCKYLGLPLTIRKQTAAQLSGLMDQLASLLPSWKGANMPKSGRMLLVKSVLCVLPIHAMMALDTPHKTITTMIKICRGFLWSVTTQANGGQCAVGWDEVCTPRWAGCLGIPDLKWLNTAMQARWPWLKKTDPARP
ncbi:uncharacterized protein [Aegilops tauschii subsp. strangulata]|uniref:uncharacterized protein n=1 Tax=Aegilops tauschii subsp. strangulata TaxID=200361 RepID=UPI003CC8C34A